jgi:RHS repeat-associated protein
MTVLTNPSTIDHSFGFNKVNRNTSYQTPLSGSYSYVYDKDRRLKQTNFPSGNQINNIYANGRLEQIQTPEGNIDFTYLCGTKVGSITKGSESITYGYDGKLVTSETLSGTLNQPLGYTYNDDFNLTSLTYAGGTESNTYDNDGLLTGSGSFAITRNAGNGLPEAVTGGSLNLSRTFNGYGVVSDEVYSVSGQGITSWNLARDNNGRITNKTETIYGTTSNYVYSYDPMGRLLTVTKEGTLLEEYQYGANGTRTYEMNSLRGIAGRTLNYSDEDHLLTAGTTTYQYNVDGFLTTKTQGTDVTTYDYSSRGELLAVTLPDGRIIEYVHDPLGRRIAKKVNGAIVEKYLWEGLTRLLAVYDDSVNLLMRFEYTDGRMPVAMTKGGSTYYLTYDQVGSLRIVADASGNVVKRIDYDSFGNIISDTNPALNVPFGFAGGLHDRDMGLVRFGYRDYDPDVGRWTAKDPIGFAAGDTDLYGYCLNNPVNWIDPYGLFIGSLLSKGMGRILGRTAQEAAIAGKAADSFVGVAIEMTGISKKVPNVLGYTGDALQAIGGVQSVSLAGIVASYSSVTPAAPAVLAYLGGAELGFAFNNFYERFRGQSLGEDIYDWFHPNREDNPCK